MQSRIIYIYILVIICLFKVSFTQRGYYNNEPSYKYVTTTSDTKSIENAINEVLDSLANSIIDETNKFKNSKTVKDAKTLAVEDDEVVDGLIESNESSKAAEEKTEISKTLSQPPPTPQNNDPPKPASSIVKTTTADKPKPTPSAPAQNQPAENSTPQNPSPPPSSQGNTEKNTGVNNSGQGSNSNSSSNNSNVDLPASSSNNGSSVSKNPNSSNPNSSNPNSNPSNSNSNISNNSSLNNGNTNDANNANEMNNSAETDNANAEAPISSAVANPEESPATIPVDNSPVDTPRVIPDSSNISNDISSNNSKVVPISDDNDSIKEGDKKSKFGSIALKVGVGLAVGGVCVAGLIVGKNKLTKKEDDDIYKNVFNAESLPASISANDSLGRKLEGVDNTPNYNYQPVNNYSQNQSNNYLNPNVPNPNSPINNDFIDTNSIEPLPNLVNKVDVELPVYNIHEENYNTVGRPMDEAEAAATWNDDEEANDHTKLLNNTDGYNNIVPEMGQMVIEHTNCPSFTSSMFEAMDELQDKNQNNNNNNDNMKQIIPDIQYATVEVNNEFDSIEIDDEPPHDNMKQIIPDIQYATVEVNNEFDGIDDEDDFRSTRTNPRIVVDIDAQRNSVMSSADSDVEELRASQDFLAIPDNLAKFKQISDTYHNALRDTFDGGNRDSLNSTESILHKLR